MRIYCNILVENYVEDVVILTHGGKIRELAKAIIKVNVLKYGEYTVL